MKKTKLLKIALTLVMAFVVGGAFAQVANSDYGEYDANKTAPTNVDYVTLKSSGTTTMGYYAEPDPIYHTGYVTPAWALTAGFTWTWTIPTNPGTAASVSGGGTPANYVEISYTATGDYVVNVTENSPAAFGGCSGDATVMNVTVLAAPTAVLAGATSANTWTAAPLNVCGDALAEDLTVTITETGVPAAFASYAYSIEKSVININASGGDIGVATTSTLIDHAIASKYATGTANGGTETVSTGAMPIVGGERTKYTFTLKGASDAASDGIVSAISHKSDYIAGAIEVYAFGGTTTVTYIVNPKPTTGPIYYIPNNTYL